MTDNSAACLVAPYSYRCTFTGCNASFPNTSEWRFHALSIHWPAISKNSSASRDDSHHKFPEIQILPKNYFCTFQACTAIFSVAAEWRFHALTTHFEHITLWICPERVIRTSESSESLESDESVEMCQTGFKRPADLRAHMKAAHNMPITHDATIEHMAVGPDRECFWCGFCRLAIKVDEGLGLMMHGQQKSLWEVARNEHLHEHFLHWKGEYPANRPWADIHCPPLDKRDEETENVVNPLAGEVDNGS